MPFTRAPDSDKISIPAGSGLKFDPLSLKRSRAYVC